MFACSDAEGVEDNSRGQSGATPPEHVPTSNSDPEGVAYCELRCDPFRVGIFCGFLSGGDAPGYYISRLRREEIDPIVVLRVPFSPPTILVATDGITVNSRQCLVAGPAGIF